MSEDRHDKIMQRIKARAALVMALNDAFKREGSTMRKAEDVVDALVDYLEVFDVD